MEPVVDASLREAFLGMKRQAAVDLVRAQIDGGTDPLELLGSCRGAMEEVGRRFETGELFLSELIYSAEVFKAISAILQPVLQSARKTESVEGSVVFGTPLGDIHDLGKNIVITMMRAHGLAVHDLGVNVPPEKFIAGLQTSGSRILAMSALITPAFEAMKQAVSLLHEQGMRQKTLVIIGGAVTSEMARREVGADAQTLDPTEAIRICRRHLRAV